MANTYLTRTFVSGGSGTTWTFSAWVKRSGLGGEQPIFSRYQSSSYQTFFGFAGSNQLVFKQVNAGSTTGNLTTNRLFTDITAYYHLVVVWDTTNGTAGDRMKLYVNGVEETSFATDTNPSSGLASTWGNANPMEIARSQSAYFNGIMSHVNFCDGTALAPTVFGEIDATTGEWKIKVDPSFTLGTTGFTILKDGNTITDQSSNSNNWTLGGGTLTATEDCPSDIFCTFNPLHQGVPDRELIYTNGNGTIASSASNWQPSGSTLAVPPKTGKWYWEFSQFVSSQFFVGLMASNCQINTALPYECLGLMTYFQSGRLTLDNSATEGYFTAISNQTDVVGVALDMTAGTYGQAQFYRNGSATGSAVALTSNFANQFVMPFGMCNGTGRSVSLNTGNGYFGTTAISSEGTNASGIGKFEYDVPANHKPLSTKGLNA